jgi:NTE family protein
MLDFVKRRAAPPGDTAPELPPQPTSPKRLSIGLALGGGAARGFAHIGVLRTLQKHGIDAQVIAGTSIGAVVGGLYAAGRLDAFEEWARGLTRRRVFGYLDFSITGSGLIGGARLSDSLTREIAGLRIEDLSAKLTTIATEIGTGHEIWLTRGSLTDALSASYALPGLFPPVSIGGRWLMDGALVNPVPVSAVRASGARLVIAVNLSMLTVSRGTTIQAHEAAEKEASEGSSTDDTTAPRGLRGTAERLLRRKFAGTPGKPGFSTVMIDAFNIMQDRITRARLAGDPPDVTITPKLEDVGFFDFHRADEAIAAGALATERSLEAILEAAELLA